MLVPEEFRRMAERFHQDIFEDWDSSWSDLTKFVVGGLSPKEQKKLKAFLSEIVSNHYSDEQLQNLWSQTAAEVGFPEGIRIVLTQVREHIEW
jgi:hypothetical protein